MNIQSKAVKRRSYSIKNGQVTSEVVYLAKPKLTYKSKEVWTVDIRDAFLFRDYNFLHEGEIGVVTQDKDGKQEYIEQYLEVKLELIKIKP